MIYRFWSYKWWGTQWYNFNIGVKNIWRWLPVIYQDRWWDHSFLYPILRKKLELMEKNFRLHGCHLNNEKDAFKMKKCVLLLDRLINDAYIDYKNERGWAPKVRFSFEKEEEMIEQDLDLLFKLLSKNIRTWWD
jgi:hypothetical protein